MILFYGCWTSKAGGSDTGHYFFDEHGQKRVRRRDWEGRLHDNPADYVPWGAKVDGGLAPRNYVGGEEPNGVAAFSEAVLWASPLPDRTLLAVRRWCWSALSWWDNSVDKRGGSSATFIIDRCCTPRVLLNEARAAFPQIFARFSYEIVLPNVA